LESESASDDDVAEVEEMKESVEHNSENNFMNILAKRSTSM